MQSPRFSNGGPPGRLGESGPAEECRSPEAQQPIHGKRQGGTRWDGIFCPIRIQQLMLSIGHYQPFK